MIERVLWALLALLHVVPAFALLRPSLISQLYGVDAGGPVFALLHHRAALFLVVFVVALWAAIDPAVRKLASIAVSISVVSFLVIYWQAGAPVSLRTIAIADLVGLPILACATWLAWRAR
ncbi:hypothetical protein [Aurantiacibacter sp. D1-12]|uniref:hypothetical protein n=1 Tax=Aurantiacibacter sp. D1-12 TaxID=2993658 RepID=UPI00237C7093|nr:hypothetical protein [Aurantiacibacter sp. D1-12]MDE1467345.1 hypothetical protein [Aurantiacibacter sp. D1-12]